MGKGIINYDAATTNELLAYVKKIKDGGGINLDAPKDGNLYGQKDGEWEQAQEKLVEGENIKTINGVSVLGSGNIDVAPTIGENGNWYINGKDTGKPAKGKDGADGVSLGEIALVQETGTGSGSNQKVMSQEAVTNELNKRTTEYNVSVFHPTSGTSGTNRYDLAGAISQVPAELRTDGLTVSFLNESGDTEKWEFSGGAWVVSSFSQVGANEFYKLEKAAIESNLTNKYELFRNTIGLGSVFSSNLFIKDALSTYTVDENEKFTASTLYEICRVKLEAGKTYYRYNDIAKSNWNSTNCRLFDDTGFLQVFGGTDISVPAEAKNPYIYLTVMQNDKNKDKYMFTEEANPISYIPPVSYTAIKDLQNSINNVSEEIENTNNSIKELDLVTVKKILTRTDNLFNPNDDTYFGKTISDTGKWSTNSAYNSVLIPLEAGKTYKRYSKAGTLSDWAVSNIRVFDNNGDGSLLIKSNTNSVTIPQEANNPVGIFAFPVKTTLNPQLFMVLEDGINGEEQIPYYNISYEQDLTDYIKSLVKDIDISNAIVQGEGDSEDKVMSQKAVTDSLSKQKNDLQTKIENAILGLTSSSIEQGKGQSTSSTISQKGITDLLAELAEGLQGDTQYRYADRPSSGYENFFVDVDVNIATTNNSDEAVEDSINLQKDRCVLALPKNYSRSGRPTRLIICGHGTGWKCISSTAKPWVGDLNLDLFLNEGYALLGLNGTPGDLDGLTNGNNGTPQCYRSILAAYKYVVGKYNIATNGVFTIGYSMGTLMTTQISCFNDIPVLAQIVYSPSFPLMKSQFTLKSAEVRERMCDKFGFIGQKPTFTSQNPPSEQEQQYVLDNFDKWCGYDPLINGMTGGKAKETFSIWVASSRLSDESEKELYENLGIVRKIPIKFFLCDDDTTASPRWTDYLTTMMRNAGCYCEARHYATGGHTAPPTA